MAILAFDDTIIFPIDIKYGSGGGPSWNTRIIRAYSGAESRNQGYSQALRPYDVSYGINTKDKMEAVLELFEATYGPTTGFRFLDHMDYKTCRTDTDPARTDQVFVASAAGGETTTQIIKNYIRGTQTAVRNISKPFGTWLIERNGGLLTEGVDYDIDYDTGIITWDTGVFPSGLTATDVIKGGGQFHVPVRFATDLSFFTIDNIKMGNFSCQLIELRV